MAINSHQTSLPSGYPLPCPNNNDAIDSGLAAAAAMSLESFQSITVKLATNSDSDMLELQSIIETGFPEYGNKLPSTLHDYHQFRNHLYCIDGVIMYKDRIQNTHQQNTHHTPLRSPRSHLHDSKSRIHRILARHRSRHHED